MNLKLLTLIISIIGISLLLILSNILEPKLSKISDLNTKQTYEQVKIQGQLINQKSFSNTLNILEIKDSTGTIQVLTNKNLQLKTNSTIQVIGKISEYKSRIQITADKIKILS